MTKRIYKADNPQDVKELFQLLDKLFGDREINYISRDAKIRFVIVSGIGIDTDLPIDFCGKSEITRPMEIKVGQFGKFWDSRPDVFIYGFLTKIARKYPYYIKDTEEMYEHFTPITADSDEGKKILKTMGRE